ncbi:LysM peptidoglycan-binding domain-containing protein [Brevundimonas albigilva]|uniref:LysM peptidoglycan-binding domain-containing protein n=1 Tax=Brevundimonas albigilva TaxID=1312364 RepID=UPI00201B6190|nr:LysM peptidoglycan-binding domain-containing protein [Brevundimonas albigilva]UQV18613.1 LysM peptidoglycan-binding domain-containing protein [Brevundimonas albigilva]
MTGLTGWTRTVLILAAGASLTACISYPSEPRYPTHPMALPGQGAPTTSYPPQGQQGPAYPGGTQTQPYRPGQYEAPPPATAPVGSVEGGALPPTVSVTPPTQSQTPPPPPYSGQPGAAYVIQPGDTISGVGRRFQTPVQLLIDLNGLGPRGAITTGQRIILPESAVDTGRDPYATGPSPVGVLVPNGSVPRLRRRLRAMRPCRPRRGPSHPRPASARRRRPRPARPIWSGRSGARSCAASARWAWASATTASTSAPRPARPLWPRAPGAWPMSAMIWSGRG